MLLYISNITGSSFLIIDSRAVALKECKKAFYLKNLQHLYLPVDAAKVAKIWIETFPSLESGSLMYSRRSWYTRSKNIGSIC